MQGVEGVDRLLAGLCTSQLSEFACSQGKDKNWSGLCQYVEIAAMYEKSESI